MTQNEYPNIPGLTFLESKDHTTVGTYYGQSSGLFVFTPWNTEELFTFAVWVNGLLEMGDAVDESIMLEIGEKVVEGYAFGDFLQGFVELDSL